MYSFSTVGNELKSALDYFFLISLLKEMGYSPVIYFCNPNLDTEEEFNKRLDAQKIVCMYHWVDLVIEDYKHEEYLETVKGLGNIFLGGEGLFLTKLVGPGKVIIQSQNFGDFAGRVLNLLPKKYNG